MKILMVCLGNICRSPLAHGILEEMIKSENLDWEVDSCGTSGYHDGELPDSRSLLLNYSFPDENRRVPDPYYEGGFDLVYTMIYKACLKLIEKEQNQ